MIASSLLPASAGIPAAVIVAVGVLGALDVRSRRRVGDRVALARTHASRIPGHGPDAEAPAEVGLADDQDRDHAGDAKERALRLLDAWSECPRSTWHAVGVRRRRTTRAEAGVLADTQLILDGILAHHVSAIDAWLVREAVDTAWLLAPDDQGPMPPAVECAARCAVTNAALAVLAQDWLPAEDFDRLRVSVGH